MKAVRQPAAKSLLQDSRGLRMVCFAASFCISFLIVLACNLWIYETESIRLEEGDWHVRILQPLSDQQKKQIQASAWVSSLTQTQTEDGRTITELTFAQPARIYEQLPELEQLTGLDPEETEVHDLLLSRMLITDPQDPSPPLLLPAMLGLLLLCLLALVLVLKSAYSQALSARLKTLAALSTLGATPKQIRQMLISLCLRSALIPVTAGTICGILLCFMVIQGTNVFLAGSLSRHAAKLHVPWQAAAASFFLSFLTFFLACLQPAHRLAKTQPLQLVRSEGMDMKGTRKLSFLRKLGIHGVLVDSFLASRRRSTRLSRMTLFLSCLAFCLMLSFTALAFLSTEFTYFERYQDVWDIRVDIQDLAIEDFQETAALQQMEGVASAAVYQTVQAAAQLETDWQSSELRSLGGLPVLEPETEKENILEADVNLVVLDDHSFEAYLQANDLPGDTEGAVAVNRIWDSTASSFRDPIYIPFLNPDLFSSGSGLELSLRAADSQDAKAVLPVSASVSEPPVLREEYDRHSLVLVCPLSLWKSSALQLTPARPETRINVVASSRDSLPELDRLEQEVLLAVKQPEAVSENRLREKADNEQMKAGSNAIWSLLCLLVALGALCGLITSMAESVHSQKRMFAQLQSLGMTQKDLNRIFLLEAADIVLPPILFSLILTLCSVWGAALLSSMQPAVFFQAVPWGPILAFCLLLFFCVLISFFLLGRKLQKTDLAAALKDDPSF